MKQAAKDCVEGRQPCSFVYFMADRSLSQDVKKVLEVSLEKGGSFGMGGCLKYPAMVWHPQQGACNRVHIQGRVCASAPALALACALALHFSECVYIPCCARTPTS